MIRIFSILSALTMLMILIAGGGTYWVAQSNVTLAQQKVTESSAQGIASSISHQLHTLQETVIKMAATPEVIAAIESQDSLQMAQTSLMLEQFLPRVMKIRLLLTDVSELDNSSMPHMGNADLVMVQETLIKPSSPAIQGEGKNRHLAITAVVKKNDVAIGVILASLNYDFLQSILKNARVSDGFIELKQNNIALAKAGDISNKTDLNNTINITKTLWKVHYWPDNTQSIFSLSLIGIILIPVLIIALAFFISYRNITRILRQDLASLMKAIKDLMSGKTVGNYPMALIEMKSMVSNIVQYKRVLNNEGKDLSSKVTADTNIDDGFFAESSDSSFLDSSFDAEDSSSAQLTESSPVSLPSHEEHPHSVFATDVAPLSSTNSQSKIFKAYDIRGIADESLTKEIIFDIGRAVGSEAKEKNIKTIVLGQDGRTSSPALAESFSKGIISTGVNILDIGLVPSPLVYFVAHHTEGKSGVVITGSHNPANYNGLKIIINGETLAADKIQQLKQRIDNENYLSGETGSIEQNSMFTNEYIGILTEDIRIARQMKVVVDCGNGAAGELAPILLKTLGCEVIELFCDIDGTFPNHHPDPSKPENLTDLIAAVQHYQADVGIAFDGDGDRLGVVDSKGKIIWADRQMMLFAKDVLSSKPGAGIIYDVKCSSLLGQQITKLGGRPLMWKSGHSLMKAKLKETNAALAGEMSGHIFFNDRWFGFDDALYAASRLIEILSTDTRNSNEVFADFPDNINTPEINIELSEGENIGLMEKIFSQASFDDGKIINIDGMRVEFADGWGLVRASNTMPALTLRFEGDSTEALNRIQSQFKNLLTQVKPDIAIPF